MARVYFNLILNGRKTIEDVPPKLRDEVQALIDEWNATHPVI